MPSAQPKRSFSLYRVFAALVAVAGVTAVLTEWLPVNASTAGFCYLLVVLAAATLGIFTEAAIAASAAMLSFNFYFLPPVGRFTIADPQNWVALLTFLVTALVASHLSGHAQERAAEAKRRQEETEQLYALSRAILLAEPTQAAGAQEARHIAQIFGLSGVVLFERERGTATQGGTEDLPDLTEALRTASIQGTAIPWGEVTIWPISLGGNPVGAIALKGGPLSDGAMQALLNLLAISLERSRTAEEARRIALARDSEEFKSTLLDAIAHEFKTPLTSIKAASTALMEQEAGASPIQQELASIIDEETDRLSELVTEAVRMARIDAGEWRLDRVRMSVAELVRPAIERFAGRGEERVQLRDLADSDAQALVDANIAGLALRLLLDNALKYSPPNTPVQVTAESGPDEIRITITDRGPGIPAGERDKVFEKFYRSAHTRHLTPGTGLGLHIAREIARAHGGSLMATEAEGAGARFVLAFPRVREEK